jgi:hypothetical protein
MQTSSSVLGQLSGRGGSGERGEEERKSGHEPFLFLLCTVVEKHVEVSRRPVGARRRYWYVLVHV